MADIALGAQLFFGALFCLVLWVGVTLSLRGARKRREAEERKRWGDDYVDRHKRR